MRNNVRDFMSITKAVHYSGYSEQYLRRLVRRGVIHAIKFGHIWMVNVESLKTYLEKTRRLGVEDSRYGPRQVET